MDEWVLLTITMMVHNGFLARKLSASQLPINSIRRTLLSSHSHHVIECTRIKPSKTYKILGSSLLKSVSPFVGLGLASSSKGPYSCKAMYTGTYQGETPEVEESWKEQVMSDLPMEQVLSEVIRAENNGNSVEISEDDKEIQRRRKIGLANKGKVPWNKGRKHSEGTRERIKQRTKEALKDPKVRKKMSEYPRSLSYQTKARIRSSLRKLWGKRLQWKRSRENLLQAWAESIANAAKIGGIEQQELDWDSYHKIKREIALKQLQQATEKAKAKEMARIQAERASQAKAEKTAKLTQKKKEREENAKHRAELNKKRNKKSKEEKEQLAVSHELKLRERLIKIHRKKSAASRVSSQQKRPWEKFDIAVMKKEQLQKEISLADQIRFAKSRRAEYATQEALDT
ncbi:golgin subfamily A member 6 22 [Olea europaea subsp. europaea]|uniref:Golgin subfamily A member 6 22 n=1 Tax=Olea europaea subsp. europaea TaxID=158383 RepID=A0A8S0PJW3_OLEEU|nr:golgin subfamily A member 6 22 [Olea europaea subsp. europaea]